MTDLNIEDIGLQETFEIEENTEDCISVENLNQEIPKLPLYILKLDYSKESFFAFLPDGIQIEEGDFVVVPTKYGTDIARVCGKPSGTLKGNAVTIIRAATEQDLKKRLENEKKAGEAESLFREKVKENSLNMKFIACHFMPEEPKVLFFFSADARIDFRKLVKDLVNILKIRVELRQIGVRDEARIVGGMGCCGRPFCCSHITDKVQPVSIKMAKEQNISLSSTKISGPCGRLLCCLGYEYSWYADLRKNLPPENTKIPYDNTVFKIIQINPLTGIISLLGEDSRMLTIPASRLKKNDGLWAIL